MTIRLGHRIVLPILSLLCGWPLALLAQPMQMPVSNFNEGDMSGWTSKRFKGMTHYSLVRDGDRQVLKAMSEDSASGMYKKIKIDLNKTPYLIWSWKVIKPIEANQPETQKQGDDYSARIYVVVSDGWKFWSSRALNYVWSMHQAEGATWPNAFTDKAILLSVEQGKEHVGRWITYKRNVKQDLERYLGESIDTIEGIAIMTDSDNTGDSAQTLYGEIIFSPK